MASGMFAAFGSGLKETLRNVQAEASRLSSSAKQKVNTNMMQENHMCMHELYGNSVGGGGGCVELFVERGKEKGKALEVYGLTEHSCVCVCVYPAVDECECSDQIRPRKCCSSSCGW